MLTNTQPVGAAPSGSLSVKNNEKPISDQGFSPDFEPGQSRPKSPKVAQIKQTDIEGRNSLLSTREAATAIGISSSEFKRREMNGVYKATYVDKNGWHFYAPEYVATLAGYGSKPKRSAGRLQADIKSVQITQAYQNNASRSSAFNPAVSAQIFQALDDGLTSREIVKQLLIPPDIMTKTYDAWLKLGDMGGGGIQVSAKTLAIINNLPLGFGSYPIQTEAQLLANLQEACADTTMCTLCKQHPRKYCTPCTEKMAVPVAAESAPAVKRQMGRPRKSA